MLARSVIVKLGEQHKKVRVFQDPLRLLDMSPDPLSGQFPRLRLFCQVRGNKELRLAQRWYRAFEIVDKEAGGLGGAGTQEVPDDCDKVKAGIELPPHYRCSVGISISQPIERDDGIPSGCAVRRSRSQH